MHNNPSALLRSSQAIIATHSTTTTSTQTPAQTTTRAAPLLLAPSSLRILFHLLIIATPIATTRSFIVASTTNSPSHRFKASTSPTEEDSSRTCRASSTFFDRPTSTLTNLQSSPSDDEVTTSASNPASATSTSASPPVTSTATAATNTMVNLPRYRSIRRILTKPYPHWVGDGFKVLPVFSNLAFTEHVSPFLMFDYGEPQHFPPQSPGSPPHGVGQHPHRGFETVTIAFQGQVEHHDSVGNHGVIGPGDVQWMTAGRGIVHEEYHSKEFAKTGGTLEMCQLWVNLPAAHKMTAPKYQEILSSDIPVVELKGPTSGDDDTPASTSIVGTARVIAGELLGTKGPASTFSPVQVWDVILPKADVNVELPIPSHHNVMLFVRRGRIQVLPSGGSNGSTDSKSTTTLGPQDVALLDYDESTTTATSTDTAVNTSLIAFKVLDPDTSVVLLGGQPLREPIANHGPFVMNTQEEIRQAFVDYRSGKLGQ